MWNIAFLNSVDTGKPWPGPQLGVELDKWGHGPLRDDLDPPGIYLKGIAS